MGLIQFEMPFSLSSGYVKQERERLNISWHSPERTNGRKKDWPLKSGLDSDGYGRDFMHFQQRIYNQKICRRESTYEMWLEVEEWEIILGKK